jgi:cytochrome P450
LKAIDQRLTLDEIDLSSLEFWTLPLDLREGALKTLREIRPISHYEDPPWAFLDHDEGGFWVVTKHKDVMTVSRDPKTYSSARGAVSVVDLPTEFLEFFGSMINTDDPRHGHLRRVVSRAFTPKRLAQIEGRIEALAHELIQQAVSENELDFAVKVASELPLRVICEMMGVPEDHAHFVLERSNIILGALDAEYVDPETSIDGAILNAAIELVSLMNEIGKERVDAPRDDVTSALVNASVDGESLSPSELASFFILLVVAGNETTRNAISWGMVALDEFQDQREILRSNLTHYLPTAVEEIVRWASPVMFMRRTTTRSTEISGVKLEAGEKVLLLYGSANRDEEVFEDPYSFRVDRANNDHLGFGGYGPHFCLGAHLARREIAALFREVMTYMPNYRITAEPERLRSNFINGIKHLMVSADGR